MNDNIPMFLRDCKVFTGISIDKHIENPKPTEKPEFSLKRSDMERSLKRRGVKKKVKGGV